MMSPLVLLILCLLSPLVLTGCATSGQSPQSGHSEPTLTPQQQELNLESFDMVCNTISEKHYDETLGGLDWPAIKEELRPQVAAATTMSEARKPMRDMIQRLEMSHFVIYPADVYDDAAGTTVDDESWQPSHSGQAGHSGLDLRVLGESVLVTRVDPSSPAAAQGIVPGWEVLRIGSVSLDERIKKLEEVLAGQTTTGMILSRSVEARLAGEEGDVIPVAFRTDKGLDVELDLQLGSAPGHPFTMGNLPEVMVWTRQEILDGNIGYFGFNFFLDVMTVMGDYNKAMESFRDLPGVIIDLRGNPGGLGAMAMGMAGWFVEEKGLRLGTMIMRTGEFNFVINTRASGYRGRVALLIDDLSASTSEIFAGGLQDLGLVRIFGMRTAGAALPSMIEKLPNGDGFQYAVANYISEGGKVLEGVGVVPDVEVIPTRENLLKDGDPILEAARKWLLQ
jgi:carboxyl-terminal processing protease